MKVLQVGAEFFIAITQTTRRTDSHCLKNAPRTHKQLLYTANRWHVFSFLLTSTRIQQFMGDISLLQHEEC